MSHSLEHIYQQKYGVAPQVVAKAPGRINVIGEHVDYADGLSLPAAIDRHVITAIGLRDDRLIKASSVGFEDDLEIHLDQLDQELSTWHKYLVGVFRSAFDDQMPAYGCNIALTSEVPMGAGVSSSAALEVSIINALDALYALALTPLEKVKKCQEAEARYLGVPCGLLDHYASQFSKAGQLMILDFQKEDHKYVQDNLEGYVWVTINSMVERQLAHSAYGERVAQMENGLTALKSAGVESFRDIKPAHVELISDPILRKRIGHYVHENLRTLDALEAIKVGDVATMGRLLNESHASLSNDYEVSCPELDFLATTAQNFPHCAGARMMGGGFGGCTINLVRKDKAEQFIDTVSRAYQQKFTKTPQAAIFKADDGAGIISKNI